MTMRCKSVNYFKGANYCETNYEDKASAVDKFLTETRWVYSERGDWPKVSTAYAKCFSIDLFFVA